MQRYALLGRRRVVGRDRGVGRRPGERPLPRRHPVAVPRAAVVRRGREQDPLVVAGHGAALDVLDPGRPVVGAVGQDDVVVVEVLLDVRRIVGP